MLRLYGSIGAQAGLIWLCLKWFPVRRSKLQKSFCHHHGECAQNAAGVRHGDRSADSSGVKTVEDDSSGDRFSHAFYHHEAEQDYTETVKSTAFDCRMRI